MNWMRTTISHEGTHHLLDGQPLYEPRFHSVQKFHEPGLAPAVDASGAFHIDPMGIPAYVARYLQTWGFYDLRAAVEDSSGCFHILPDGNPVAAHRYDWCGNFQENICPVRGRDKRYFHIGLRGEAVYKDRYMYAGDFRDGVAVVRCVERHLCSHIDKGGNLIHGRWFLDLDQLHKGYARARDAGGWFHVRRSGEEAYATRFAWVEPFYNGTALCETHEGERVLVNLEGRAILCVGRPGSPPIL